MSDTITVVKKRVSRAKRRLGLGVETRSPFQNLYHCCVQRTASQWFRLIFNDEVVYRHSGLYVIPFIERGLDSARIEHPFPGRTIATHLYVDRNTFDAIPKAKPYQAFFVTRDPRDIVVSFYFAAMHSHKPIGGIPAVRKRLQSLDEVAGFSETIDILDEWGLFRAQRSWGRPGEGDIPVFRFEDLATDHRKFLHAVFDHLEIHLPSGDFESLCERKSFQAVSGRSQGQEDVRSHQRRGVPGEWRDRLSQGLVDKIEEVTGGLPAYLGY